jgi:hypothetical protein
MESGEYHQIHQLKRQPVLKAGLYISDLLGVYSIFQMIWR